MKKLIDIEEIKRLQEELKKAENNFSKAIQIYKREAGITEGSKIKLTRSSYDLMTGKEIKEEYYLIIKTCYFNPKLLQFQYTFSHITPLGKVANKKCSIYHNIKTDLIEKIK